MPSFLARQRPRSESRLHHLQQCCHQHPRRSGVRPPDSSGRHLHGDRQGRGICHSPPRVNACSIRHPHELPKQGAGAAGCDVDAGRTPRMYSCPGTERLRRSMPRGHADQRPRAPGSRREGDTRTARSTKARPSASLACPRVDRCSSHEPAAGRDADLASRARRRHHHSAGHLRPAAAGMADCLGWSLIGHCPCRRVGCQPLLP